MAMVRITSLSKRGIFIVSLVLMALFSAGVSLLAAPPTSQYFPGATLDPTCAPGTTNCTVSVEPAVTNFIDIDASDSPKTVLPDEQAFAVDTSGGDVEIRLPAIPDPITVRRTIHIVKTDPANTVYINSQIGDFVNVTTSLELTDYRRAVQLESLHPHQWAATFNFDGFSTSPLIVRAATAAVLPAHSYSNGSAGVGATLTGSGALPAINGISLALSDRLLVKNEGTCLSNQCDSLENGVYMFTSNNPWVLTRTTDADETTEMSPQIVIPTEGTNPIRGKQWIQQSPDPDIGTDDIGYKKTNNGNSGSGNAGDVVQGTGGTQKRGQIAFWTSNTKELSQGNTKLFWDNTNKRFGVGTNTPAATFQVNGSSANSNTNPLFGVISTAVPATTSTSGGNIVFNGQGGSDSGVSAAGSGGDFNTFLGAGGSGTGQDGGMGGSINTVTGDGGSSDLTAGNGGRFQLVTGNGGDSSLGTPGNGGDFSITLGNAGAGPIGGFGGNFIVQAGQASWGVNGPGDSGSIQLFAGNGPDALVDNGDPSGGGGSVYIQSGNGGSPIGGGLNEGGLGGTISIITGSGGAGGDDGNSGADGGQLFIQTGSGGGNQPGSNGGDISVSTGGSPGGGRAGDMLFTTGNSIDGPAGNFIVTLGTSNDSSINGKFGIGTNSPQATFHVVGNDSSTTTVAKFESSAGTACTLSPSTGLLACSSDRTLKKDITDIDPTLANILALNPVSYRWNTDTGNADKKYGFIAQDVELLFPSLVSTDDETGKKSLSVGGLVPFMVKAIQELSAKVDALSVGTVIVSGDASTQIASFLADNTNKIVNGVTHLASLVVGSPEHRIGITLYDEQTGEPYCIKVVSGVMQNIAGECVAVDASMTPPPPDEPTEDGPGGDEIAPPISEPDGVPPGDEPPPLVTP